MPESRSLADSDAAAGARCFYRLVLWPDLFGRYTVVRGTIKSAAKSGLRTHQPIG